MSLGGVKERLKAIQDNIKSENDKADAFTKEKDTVHRNYCKIVGRQQLLKEKITGKEEAIEKSEKKFKDTQDRLRQKEEFLKEAASFNKKLTKATPNEGDAALKQKELNQYKVIYHKHNEKYMQAKEQKIELEQRFENVEGRNKEVQKKVDSLTQELENNFREEGRRGEQCKQSMDSAFRIERNVMGVQRMLDDMDKRRQDAVKKVSELKKKIAATEEELEETSYECRVIEATIKEILKANK